LYLVGRRAFSYHRRVTELSAHAAVAADYEHYVRLFAELGVQDPILEPGRWESLHMPGTVFVRAGDEVVGYGYFQALDRVGYVRHVAVEAGRRGAGVGRALMLAIAARLIEAGCSSWCLNVKEDNEPALRLYRRIGMQVAYASSFLRFTWDIVAHLPPPDRPVDARPVEPGDDAAIETAFAMPARQIASARAQGRVLVWLFDPSAASPVGFASFDPGFPGAFPFRVAHASLAAPLLDRLRPHSRAELPHMQVVVEDHEDLARVMREAGAAVTMQFLHLRGELPPANGRPRL
jgi:ribosomal protein S18 acetylase RimI-like enzyme